MSDAASNDRQSGDPADMSSSTTAPQPAPQPAALRPLRIWPLILLLVGLWILRNASIFSGEMTFSVMMASFTGPLICTGLILLWWLFLSRASLLEKLYGLVGLVAIVLVTGFLSDKSIQGFGTMIYALPWGISAFSVLLIILGSYLSTRRTWVALVAALIAFGFWDLVRTDEIRGDFSTKRSWRWEPTAEDRYLETLASRAPGNDALPEEGPQQLLEPEWPGFRGEDRRGVQPGIVLAEDWQANPLRELWRIKVGPGWSSFAVAGNQIFTQEQRGESEVVVCYDARSGAEVWSYQDKSRFWEAVGGAGPRATPTLSGGNLYALGATGHLHRLNPVTGEQVWQRDLNVDANRKPPTWGYASSPLVVGDVVIVHAGGQKDKGLLAYDTESGELRWCCAAGDHSYSSPQLAELDGVSCVLMLTNLGVAFIDPSDGDVLGRHEWLFQGYRVVQPLVFDGSSVLIGTGLGTGTQRIDVTLDDGKLAAEEAWMSRMSPYFNDYVEHKGYLYGFDNNIFACVDLATGERAWKRGRYGNGQVLLLPDKDQLLVLAEDGRLILVRATPEKLVELTEQPAIDGRTWNHPVLVNDRLYVRNAEEAACFEVPLAASAAD